MFMSYPSVYIVGLPHLYIALSILLGAGTLACSIQGIQDVVHSDVANVQNSEHLCWLHLR